MNKISFNGKNEVIYGLKKAAMCARAAEYSRAASFGPRPVDRSIMEMTNKTSMGCYLDMVCYDKSFTDTISNMKKEDISELGSLLKNETVQYGDITPFKLFKENLKSLCKHYKKTIPANVVNDFLNKLTINCK